MGPPGVNAELGKRKRTGSPVPPKILYKSTTGKGVAFTTADVQYLLDYLKYRRSVLFSDDRVFETADMGTPQRAKPSAGHGRVLE